MKEAKFAALLNAPVGVVIRLVILIMAIEVLIMLVIEDALVPAIFSKSAWIYVDASLLTLILVPVLYFLVFRRMQVNIAERKRRSEAEALASENRFHTLVDTLIDGVIVIDTKGLIQIFNPAATKLFGYLPDEVQNLNIKMLMPEPYANEHDGYLHNFLTTGIKKVIGIGCEVTGKRKDGSTFPMELEVSEMDVGGERLFVGVTRDITARKRAETEIITAKEEAENANRIKSQFLSQMSHEFRTPLNAILGFTQLMEMDALASGDDSSIENVRDVLSAGRHLLSLVNDVLDFAQLEAGKIRAEPSKINLLMIAIDSIGAVRHLAEARKIEVRLFNELLDDLGNIWADPLRTKQVLLNLLSNAVKYNKAGGSIEVTLETLDSEFVRLSVKDSGIGISEESINELFLPFSRLHASKDFVEGAGIGLAITKDLVEMMDGRIGVKIIRGEGSTFWIDMPTYNEHTGAY